MRYSLLLFTSLLCCACYTSAHAQSPERQFGVGVLLGNTTFAGTAVTGVYAFSARWPCRRGAIP
jgi:hypothetical protein